MAISGGTQRESGDLNSYAQLLSWLEKDLGDIRDLCALDRTKEFLQCVTETLAADASLMEPAWLPVLRASVSEIEGLTSEADQLLHLNHSLRSLFWSVTLTEASYQQHAESLRSGEELARRRLSRASLPTTDAMMLLESDERCPAAAQRAALLAVAAIRHNCAQPQDEVPLLGGTLRPGEQCDGVVDARDSRQMLVLVSGVAYLVTLPARREDVDAQALCDTLMALQADAAEFSRRADAWAGAVPALVTAAGRTTCFHMRNALAAAAQVNADNLQAIDNCLLAICLDPAETARPGDLEAVSRRLFGNYQNRWYGMSSIVVDAHGEAGILFSYTRGVDGVPALSFAETVGRMAASAPLPQMTEASVGAELLPYQRLEFSRVDLGLPACQAAAEIESAFHGEQAFFELSAGNDFFRSIGASANSALQYLLMLASHDVFPKASLPALSHAVSTRSEAGRKAGIDWIILPTAGLESSPVDFSSALVQAANQHSVRVNRAHRGYSPTFLLRRPENVLDQLAYRFFLKIGTEYATAYRGYLFRPTRWPGTIDILTSTLVLPRGVRLCTRPGGTSEVAGLFGLHLVIENHHTLLYFIPNPTIAPRLPEIHQALERRVEMLKANARQGKESSSVCA